MPDGTTRGPEGIYQETLAPPPQAPAPGSPAMPLPVSGQTVTTGAPPDYKALGANQAKADFTAASAGAGWEFDPEAMDTVLKSLHETLDNNLIKAQDDAGRLTGIDAPGDEIASHSYVDIANKTGKSYQDYLAGAVKFLTSYAETLTTIRDAYRRQDHAALDALRTIKED
ncbi:PE domain-containing protein [Amycolatopsis jejuensis]|uniref:PE domain-containing protein n=1 Tax=Amycolatopsis jejuensis TaxID=330084 RepID=UPI0005269AEC|nr:PE domain-containing protein [Amycolatopsis jejuensis]